MIDHIVIGTRGSKLALWQAEHVKALIEQNFDISVSLRKIKTTGDKILDAPLSKIGDKGLFVKEIEQALLNNEVHLAVHSMKDMPTALPEGLHISAALVREDSRDVFISNKYASIDELPQKGTVGTSSLRRRAQLLSKRPDIEIVDVRGNLDTRLSRLDDDYFEAIILAGAGVKRLGYTDRIKNFISKDMIMPAVGQGAIAIETRVNDPEVDQIIAKINHPDTFNCVKAERALMRFLEGGCQVPIGASAVIVDGQIEMEGVIASLDGSLVLKSTGRAPVEDAEKLGTQVAQDLMSQGAGKILLEIRAYADEKDGNPPVNGSSTYDH